jgi:uncharacterized protein
MTNLPTEPSTTDKIFIVLSHASYFYLPFIFPLIVYLVKKEESPVVAEAAREALNFHISWLAYLIVCCLLLLILIGLPLMIALGFFGLILSIVAIIKGIEGKSYRYPAIFRLI